MKYLDFDRRFCEKVSGLVCVLRWRIKSKINLKVCLHTRRTLGKAFASGREVTLLFKDSRYLTGRIISLHNNVFLFVYEGGIIRTFEKSDVIGWYFAMPDLVKTLSIYF